jgi:hypothetical protein
MGILANTIKHVFTINKTSVYAWVWWSWTIVYIPKQMTHYVYPNIWGVGYVVTGV